MGAPPLHVRLGPWEAFGQDEHRGSRHGFGIRTLDGIDSGVAPQYREVPRPTSPGSFDTRSYPGSRIISVSGSVKAASQRDLDSMRDMFVGTLMRLGQKPRKLTIQHGETVRWGMARIADTPVFRKTYYKPHGEYEAHFWLPDPRLYGESRTLTGSTLWHGGNADAWPVVTVQATQAMPLGYGLRIYWQNGQAGFLRLHGLGAGQRHVIDMRTGVVRRNGTPEAAIHSGAPWAVPPHREFQARVEPVAGAGVVIETTLTDTYY